MSQQSQLGFARFTSPEKSVNRPGFVLTEMLVVLGMIAASIAVMSPAVYRAGEVARQSKAARSASTAGLAQYRGYAFEDSAPVTLVSADLLRGLVSSSYLNMNGLAPGSWALLGSVDY